jgi:uncharacterized protein YxjI
MRHYIIKQKLLTLSGTGFHICDENDEVVFFVYQGYFTALLDSFIGSFLSIGCKIVIENKNTQDKCILIKRPSFLWQSYDIYYNNKIIATVKREKSWLKSKFTILSAYGSISLSGNILTRSFKIIKDGNEVANINKVPFKIADTYEILISDSSSDFLCIAITLAIDNCFNY